VALPDREIGYPFTEPQAEALYKTLGHFLPLSKIVHRVEQIA
jgi:hypothetical protein